MKRTFCTMLVVLGAALASAPAHAQPEWLLTGLAGVHLPMGDYADFAETGWNSGVSLDYRVRRGFGWGVDLGYMGTQADGADVDLSTFLVGGHWTGYIPSRSGGSFEPFGQFGLGFYNFKAEGSGVDETEGALGLNVGGGIQYMKPTSAVGFGADLTWHLAFTDEESTSFININGRIIVSFSDRSQR